MELDASSKIIFDENEDLDVQAAALQSFLLSLEANLVTMSAMADNGLNGHTFSTDIIYSEARATFVASKEKINSPLPHKKATMSSK